MPLQTTSSLDKALAVLFTFADPQTDQRVFTVSGLAELHGMDKAQVSRTLATFTKYGLVERLDKRRGYQLGWSVVHLAGRALVAQTMSSIYPALSQLAVDLEETVHFSIRDGRASVALATFEPDRRLFVSVPIGRTTPLIGSAAGYALLSQSDIDDLRSLLQKSIRPGNRASDAWAILQDQVERVRVDGFSLVADERGEGITTAAVPIFDVGNYRGRVHAAIGLSAPDDRVGDRAPELIERLLQIASNANEYLRWRDEENE